MDNSALWITSVGATVLAAGKGWVLPVLAMLAAKRRLRVAARGSGPGAKRRRPCPPLRAAAAGWRRDEGRPDPSTCGLRPGSNKGLMGRGWMKQALLPLLGMGQQHSAPKPNGFCHATMRAGRPIATETYGKKREHGSDSGDFGRKRLILFRCRPE